MKKESLNAALESIKTEAKAVSDILDYFDEESFGKAVELLKNANNIMTCASGSSGIAAKKFAHTLCCIEQTARFMPPCEAVHGGLGGLKKGDVMVMVSRGGKTAELLPIIDVCNKKGATLIAVTENRDSYLAQHSDLILPMKIERESDKYNMQATASFVMTIALFDALICALMEETGYTRDMFGLIHPGGAVGARLNGEEK